MEVKLNNVLFILLITGKIFSLCLQTFTANLLQQSFLSFACLRKKGPNSLFSLSSGHPGITNVTN